jgi:hypothetical protein
MAPRLGKPRRRSGRLAVGFGVTDDDDGRPLIFRSGPIDNADSNTLDGSVRRRKMAYAALLLLMLETASADLISPSASA